METTMHIDQTEYLGKMEGYALQGVKGMTSIYDTVMEIIVNLYYSYYGRRGSES